MQAQQLVVLVSGEVQGVGFRYWTRRRAQALGLNGSAVNLSDGRLRIIAEGPRGALEGLLRDLGRDTPGRVDRLEPTWTSAEGLVEFRTG